jgi:hypothetical protein
MQRSELAMRHLCHFKALDTLSHYHRSSCIVKTRGNDIQNDFLQKIMKAPQKSRKMQLNEQSRLTQQALPSLWCLW